MTKTTYSEVIDTQSKALSAVLDANQSALSLINNMFGEQGKHKEEMDASEQHAEGLLNHIERLDDELNIAKNSPEHQEKIQNLEARLWKAEEHDALKNQRIHVLEREAKNLESFQKKQQEIIDCKDQTILINEHIDQIKEQTAHIESLKGHLARANALHDEKAQVISDHEETIAKLYEHNKDQP